MDTDETRWTELSIDELLKIGFHVKDCPYCGNGEIHINHAPESSVAYMVCMSCLSTGPMMNTVAGAIDKWNNPIINRETWTKDGWVLLP